MRPRRFKLNKPHAGREPEALYARQKTAAWMLAVIERRTPMDAELLGCLSWVFGGKKTFLKYVFEELKGAQTSARLQAASDDLKSRLEDAFSWSEDMESFLEDHPKATKMLRTQIAKFCNEFATSGAQVLPEYALALAHLHDIFGISHIAAEICEYIFLKQQFEFIEDYFENHLHIHTYSGRRTFMQMLGVSSQVFVEAFGELKKNGLIDNSKHAIKLADGVEQFWEPGTKEDLASNFCKPLRGEALPLDLFNIPKADLKYTLGLLKCKGKAPVHIMLYGPPGTGKTTFVRSLAQDLGVKAWAVPANEEEGDTDRRSALTACLHMALHHPGAFVLMDEAERLLDSSPYASSDDYGKAWINELLERPGLRVIWITNHITHIDQAVRRRFSYSIHFAELGKREREGMWEQILERHKVCFFEQAELRALAKEYAVEAGVIEASVRQAKRLARGRKKAFTGALEQYLESYLKLRNNGKASKRKPELAENYSEDGVCLNGSVQDLMTACRRADAAMRANKTIPAGAATMLLYGPSGTGKTALARYIAKCLGRECMLQKASDILSPYVGEAEQNIAQVFAKAEQDGAVLVIDEADSFIYSRESAVRSWETSLVNEFLTNLEDCRCFCICTTNRRGALDAAAMRRFAHKVEFGYAKPGQLIALYNKLLAPLASGALDKTLERQLLALQKLAPGDFRTVESRFGSLFGAAQTPTHEAMLAALREEQSLKLENTSRKIGFGR